MKNQFLIVIILLHFLLSMSGYAAPPKIWPTTINMGSELIGLSGNDTLTITNVGDDILSVNSITSSNPQFIVSPTHFNLSANQRQIITITFIPTITGWEQSILTIIHDGEDSPNTVTANGIGAVIPPTGSLIDTKIAFTRQTLKTEPKENEEKYQTDIYTMNINGTNLVNLTNHPAVDEFPSWSPDGTKIAFSRNINGSAIYVVNVDGTNPVLLTPRDKLDLVPSWSPDGTKIAFYESDFSGRLDRSISVMNPDGTNRISLTLDNLPVGVTATAAKPSWSPDAQKIAFGAAGVAGDEIFVMNADGSNQVNLGQGINPAWSLDGAKIAFRSPRDSNIYIMNADGSNPVNLFDLQTFPFEFPRSLSFSWLPDGSKIAFADSQASTVYVMGLDGSAPIELFSEPVGKIRAAFALSPILKDTSSPTEVIFPRESDIYQVDLALDAGVSIFSLPLHPETSITASQLAAELGATFVIRAVDGKFQAFIPKGIAPRQFGEDFELEVGKGVILNLLEPQAYHLEGHPWGTKVPAAPTATITETWAFVVVGQIDGTVLTGGQLQVTNLRTGEIRTVPISSDGEFIVSFVDMSKQNVVAVGDEILTQLVGPDSVPLTKAQRHIISQQQIAHATLLTYFSATPNETQLLQNYPNPFNPETWIPFQLSGAASVEIEIYDLNGGLIRRLDLGHRAAGWHLSKGRAAYWDGRNSVGEKVSSSIYFYHLRAGDFSAQRKLVVAK